MCDYSLSGLPNRLAIEGEELVTHRFRTGVMGLASPAELSPTRTPMHQRGHKNNWEKIKSFFGWALQIPDACAVCVPPGARLVLTSVPNQVSATRNVAEGCELKFTQTSADVNTHRDALVMPDGSPVLLQVLPQGMRMRVLSLAGAEELLPVFEEAAPNSFRQVVR
jgi:hypothetical protein